MNERNGPPHDFGVSWGIRGFRIGRSQYGTWWVSIWLPFGIRITRRLGRERSSLGKASEAVAQPHGAEAPPLPNQGSAQPLTHNQEILEKIRSKGK